MTKIVLRFRALSEANTPGQVATLSAIADKTRALFGQSRISIEVDFVEGETTFSIPATATSGPIPNDVVAQDAMIERLRNDHRAPANEKDIVVYFLEVDTCDGFTVPDSPDIVLDISRIGCVWVLAHELGHLLGTGRASGQHDPGQRRLMYAFPCSILKPPPNFGPDADEEYPLSQYCQ